MKRLIASGLLCAAVVLGVSACSSDDTTPQEKATKAAAEMCSNLTQLRADNAKLKTLNPATATKDQIQDAYNAVQTDWKNLKASRETMKSAERDAVQSSAEDLKKAYENLPGDTTGKDALSQLQPQIRSLDDAVRQAATTQCPSS
ncbi:MULTISPECIES: hypothetical protein [unclassified Streptomyces]|uniref:hypothetical protein n=1 Tax=unclassified Streptomyces TaxID=2593676 RepID=UPI002E304E82|nr:MULTISPECIES: hypothetical protein [unclassified Streptomyces]WUC64487.1 hypothetical protein OG861_09690 [Streptomyces sp. NBC_00539]